MKKIIILVALGFVAASASAQLASDMDLKTRDVTGDYNLLSISYDNTGIGYTEKDDEDITSLNGAGIEYIHGFGIGNNPMSIEVGAKFQFGVGSESDSGDNWKDKYTLTLSRLSIPVSYAYHVSVGDNMILTPYIGVDFRFNLFAKMKNEYTYRGESEKHEWDWFSKDDMDDDTANRFQLGWHIGARFSINKFFVGLNYGTDFIPFFKEEYGKETYKISTSNLAVNVGFRF